jgi:uncharacterized repeat protein (TIGR01451 family)
VLSRSRLARRVLAGVAVCLALAMPATALAAARAPARGAPGSIARTMTVAPALGLPGLVVRFSGRHVPVHTIYRIYFDVTTADKVQLCVGNVHAKTSWACAGRIPKRYGSLGLHTVEMDATTPTGRGAFEELSTFLVSDLGVSMASPATTAPGDTVQLKVTIANGNAKAATNVRVHDHLPAGLTIKKVTAPCIQKTGLETCGPMQLRAHTAKVVVITAIVTAGRGTHLVDKATISGSPDPIKRNDTATIELTVT